MTLRSSVLTSIFIVHVCVSKGYAWDGGEVARVGEGEEGGLVGSAELGDPDLAGGPVLPMKL